MYWLLFLKTFTAMLSLTIGIHALNKMNNWYLNWKERFFWCLLIALNFTFAFNSLKDCL